MKTKRTLAWLRYELVSLLLECAFAIAALAILATAVPTILILAAQLDRLATTGDWRGFALSELFDVLQIDASARAEDSQPLTGFVLALPATLVLLLATLILCVVACGLHRLVKRERMRFSRTQQSALIEDIERHLGKQ
jgi:hypothetical protein